MDILENVPLAPMTTLQVGGPARYFVQVSTSADAAQAVDWAKSRQLPLFVLGGGSNLVVADRGIAGLVLKIAIGGIERRSENGKEVFEAGAGVEWDTLVARAVAANCAGLECMSGIPGTVGGTPVQNVGAYGQDVSQTITEVQVLDLRDGRLCALCNEACGFEYRSSIFNTAERGRYIILRAAYALEPGGEPTVEYRDLKTYFATAAKVRPTLAEVREAVQTIRHSKAMLIVEGEEDARSAGSFFKNPVLDAGEYKRVSALENGPMPSYPTGNQRFKIPAAWLVEKAGFHKGYACGSVGISRKHALAIVNRGGATAAEIVVLKNEIQRAVFEKFGVALTPEPVFVGFE
ncbi:MAG TPA: UDP-N-acetylmuramate dehydrogenase [Terriglobales bacterium]|nr:UDP-N-acetylmuramate dehydrogenase [Terriglobales bacterium]